MNLKQTHLHIGIEHGTAAIAPNGVVRQRRGHVVDASERSVPASRVSARGRAVDAHRQPRGTTMRVQSIFEAGQTFQLNRTPSLISGPW